MLTSPVKKIIGESTGRGWVLEPDAKKIMKSAGLDIPASIVTADTGKALDFLKTMTGPVVAKAVSGDILHKTEHRAVVTDIEDPALLENQMKRLLSLPGCKTVLIEEMVKGLEVIVGAKNDFQFGPVIIFGTGGTGVEIYNDTAIRMAPLKSGDVLSMAQSLQAKQVLKGFRGMPGINMEVLATLMLAFSHLVMELAPEFESIDLNPVICTGDRCVIADARIILLHQGAEL